MTDLKRWGLGLVWALFACTFLVYCAVKPPAGTSAGRDAAAMGGGYKVVIPGQSRFFIATPGSTTYTVPTGAYVTSFSCVPEGGASNGGVQITPVGPGTTIPEAGPVVNVPAGYEWGLDTVLQSPPQAFSAGTVFVLTGTTCTITLYQAY